MYRKWVKQGSDMRGMTGNLFFLSIMILFVLSIVIEEVFAYTEKETKEELEKAKKHFLKGEYKQAVRIYDLILENQPYNELALKMTGISHNINEDYTKSLKQFHKMLQVNPDNVLALTGMGIGFGNLGEYDESLKYFDRAEIQQPNSKLIKNYKILIENTIHKYPYTSTEKPENNRIAEKGNIPDWVKNTVKWWSLTEIGDEKFLQSLEYLIKNEIVRIPEKMTYEKDEELKMISVIRSDLSLWAQNQVDDEIFYKNIHWLYDNKFINSNIITLEKTQEDLNHEKFLFNQYLRDIKKNINDEKRYIEYSNPSQSVIKKFLRDYAKWNFEDQVKISSVAFPDPRYTVDDGTYNVIYKIYINQQPPGLPLDHKETLKNSFGFWENSTLKVNQNDAKFKFEITKSKVDANVWITWVVRNMGEGVLGHAHVGKGVVEVALGDYSCDGSFQLYDKKSVEAIMTHELGHSIGLLHTNDKRSIMYPSMQPSYAYCLLAN